MRIDHPQAFCDAQGSFMTYFEVLTYVDTEKGRACIICRHRKGPMFLLDNGRFSFERIFFCRSYVSSLRSSVVRADRYSSTVYVHVLFSVVSIGSLFSYISLQVCKSCFVCVPVVASRNLASYAMYSYRFTSCDCCGPHLVCVCVCCWK